MSPRVKIDSYFSIDTDLAAAMRPMSEFVSGQGYNVRLTSKDGSSHVETRFVPGTEDELPCLVVSANQDSELFHRVLGLVTYALADNSDNLQVTRRDKSWMGGAGEPESS